MTAEEKIKAAAAEQEALRQQHLAVLKRELAVGIEDLANGRYQSYDDSNLMQLAEDVCKSGRNRLKANSSND